MSSSTVTVFVASPDTRSERRYDLHITLELLKVSVFFAAPVFGHETCLSAQSKLESVTGIPIDSQRITLHNQGTEENESAEVLAVLDDDRKTLGYYGIRDWQVLKVSHLALIRRPSSASFEMIDDNILLEKVKDTNPATASLAGQYTDVSRVEKFEITEEEYAARQGLP
jgi:tubulin-specific chaperone B